MEKTIWENVCKEYGLAVMDCVLNELAKIPGFERLSVVKHAHDFLVKECKDEIDALLSNENVKAEYTALQNKLDTLLPIKKKQLVTILEIENITALFGGK